MHLFEWQKTKLLVLALCNGDMNVFGDVDRPCGCEKVSIYCSDNHVIPHLLYHSTHSAPFLLSINAIRDNMISNV